MNLDAVMPALREAGERFIRPRFRRLRDGDVSEKSPGELVTVADRDAEHFITLRLREFAPSIPVIGEEAVAEDPSLLGALYRGETCFLLDPLDGTKNFIAGDPRFGVAAALVERGEAVAAWIWLPELGHAWEARLGGGTYKDGQRVHTTSAPPRLEALRGTLHSRFLPAEQRARVEAVPIRHVVALGSLASAVDYPSIIEGELDFVGWSRILPWDHAPGALLLREAGGAAYRMDGSPYRADATGFSLLGARTDETWHIARSNWLTTPAGEAVFE